MINPIKAIRELFDKAVEQVTEEDTFLCLVKLISRQFRQGEYELKHLPFTYDDCEALLIQALESADKKLLAEEVTRTVISTLVQKADVIATGEEALAKAALKRVETEMNGNNDKPSFPMLFLPTPPWKILWRQLLLLCHASLWPRWGMC